MNRERYSKYMIIDTITSNIVGGEMKMIEISSLINILNQTYETQVRRQKDGSINIILMK